MQIAVLVANAVVQQLQPSIYDSIIEIKDLPYLPEISRTGYRINVGDIMDTRLFYISTKSTYLQLRNLLRKSKLLSFALVDKQDSMILLGSILRPNLDYLLARQLAKGQTGESKAGLEPIKELNKVSYNPSSDSVDVVFNERQAKTKGDRRKKRKSSKHKSAVRALQSMFVSSTEASEAATSSGEFGDTHCPAWEMELLREEVDFSHIHIDAAPFQLVEQTSLYKTHKLFCLLNLSHAYVTSLGQLIGVVSLQELRLAIEDEQFFLDRRRTRREESEAHTTESDNELCTNDNPTSPSNSETVLNNL